MKNYKIADGQAIFSISEEKGFQSVQVVYNDFVCFLSRLDIIGKDSEELWRESIQFLATVQENRRNLVNIVKSALPSEDGKYTTQDLINSLNAFDPEIVSICNLPIIKNMPPCDTTHMNFVLESGSHVFFQFDKCVGLKYVKIIYNDGCIFSVRREQLIGKDIPQIHQEVNSAIKRTCENRKTLVSILHGIFKENPKEDVFELLNLLFKSDPEICTVCGISPKDYE